MTTNILPRFKHSLVLFISTLVLCHLPRYSGVPHGSLISPLSSFANWKSLITILECFRRLKYTKFSNCVSKQIKVYQMRKQSERTITHKHTLFKPVVKCYYFSLGVSSVIYLKISVDNFQRVQVSDSFQHLPHDIAGVPLRVVPLI